MLDELWWKDSEEAGTANWGQAHQLWSDLSDARKKADNDGPWLQWNSDLKMLIIDYIYKYAHTVHTHVHI